jgi:hypothetical protein
VLGVLVGVVWWGYGFYAYATHDRIQLLELSEILDPAETACGDLVVTLSRPSADRAEGILAGNSSIRQLVETVRAVGDDVLADDRPARAWLADWEDLAVARATFAARLAADPAASFEVPQTDDGYPITGRMADAAGPECERAVQLAADP